MVAKAKIKKFEVKKVEHTLDFEVGDEVFHAKPELSGIALIGFVRAIQDVNSEENIEQDTSRSIEVLDVLLGLLKNALGPKEYRRFEEFMSREDIVVPIETLMEIVNFLIQEYTGGVPTEAS